MLKNILARKNLRSEFVKNAAVLITGTASAQAITLVTAPVLTRIYSPHDYGLLGIFMMVTALVGALATLQYNNIILVSKDEAEAEKAIVLCLYLSLLFSLLLLLLVIVFGNLFSAWLNNRSVFKWLFLAPISVFFMGWSTTFTYYANRHKQYKLLSVNRIISAILVPITSIGIGLLLDGPFGLFAGLLVSQVVPAILLSNHFIFRNNLKLPLAFSQVRFLVKKYKNFPIYSLPSEFINNFINQLPVLFLGRFYSASVVGYYGLSGRILGMPVQLVSAAVGEVYRQKAAQVHNETGNSQSVFTRTFITCVLLSLVPFAIILFFGPQLFTFFFGAQWHDAGVISQILTPLFLLRFTVSPLSYMFIIAGRQREDMWAHIGVVILLFISFQVSRYLEHDYYQTLILYSATYSLTYIYYLARSYQFSKGHPRHNRVSEP